MARTRNVWLPMDKPLYVVGVAHPENALPSRLHVKVLPLSVDVKLKLAVVLAVVAGGFEVIFVSGGVISIVQL